MDKFDKLKIASSSLGERLKTGSAQMSRIVSSKMKEIFEPPTPESKMIDEATLETMEEPNWGLNLRICNMINSEQLNGTEVVKAIKKKLMGKSPVSQRLSLDLLEACSSNCDKVFSEIASEKVLDEMVRMIDDPKTDDDNRIKSMQLIRAWGESEELMYLPVFQQTYLNLKMRPVPHGMQEGSNVPMQHSLESYIDQGIMSPPESYPIPDTGMHNGDFANFTRFRSAEEKREFLVETRNSLDVLSSLLNGDSESIKSELTMNLLDKCKESLPVVQRIVETTTDDEGMLFEALSLHDELQQVISQCKELESKIDSGGTLVQPSVPDTEVNVAAEIAVQPQDVAVIPVRPDGFDSRDPQNVAVIPVRPNGIDSRDPQNVAVIPVQPHGSDYGDSHIEGGSGGETPKKKVEASEKESVAPGVKSAS